MRDVAPTILSLVTLPGTSKANGRSFNTNRHFLTPTAPRGITADDRNRFQSGS